MLQIIKGPPSSGKTEIVYNKISDNAQNGRQSVLIVPEQFSFDSEKRIVERLGDANARFCRVLTFSRLCSLVEEEVGGEAKRKLNDASKYILLYRAFNNVKAQLTFFKRCSPTQGFISKLLAQIEEFEQDDIDPLYLKSVCEEENASLCAKVEDFIAIRQEYELLRVNYFFSAEDSILYCSKNIAKSGILNDCDVFFDSFRHFTNRQLHLIAEIMGCCNNISFAFTTQSADCNAVTLYMCVNNLIASIKTRAAYNKQTVLPDIVTEKSYNKSDELIALEGVLRDAECGTLPDNKSINIARCYDPYYEAEYVARTIHRLVREQGYRFGDFVIITGDVSRYEAYIKSACRRNDCPLFADGKTPLSTYPAVISVLLALECTKSFKSENIIQLLKSLNGFMEEEEISLLENYCSIWANASLDWRHQWALNPDGFEITKDGTLTDEQAKKLNIINDLRTRAIEPILQFSRDFNDTAFQRGRAIYSLICSLNINSLEIEQDGIISIDTKEELRTALSAFMGILDSLNDCFGSPKCSDADYINALTGAVGITAVGKVPQMIDEVTFGDAERIRPKSPKIAFVVGCNADVFPKKSEPNGIFNQYDRERLFKDDEAIHHDPVAKSIEQEYLVYTTLCTPGERLYITYSDYSDNAKLEPSAFVEEIIGMYEEFTYDYIDGVSPPQIPETTESALIYACREYNNKPYSEGIFQSLPEYAPVINKIKTKKIIGNISRQNAIGLYGENPLLSASRIEKYNQCAFKYFCTYGLRVSKIKPVDLGSTYAGTIIHYVFQRLLGENTATFKRTDDNTLEELISHYIDCYLSLIPGFKDIISPVMGYYLSLIKANALAAAKHIRDELKESGFTPVAFEFSFGMKDSENKAYKIPIAEGGNVSITGSIDRVDIYKEYIRVVDYKSNKVDFELSNVLVGQSLQMLIYLMVAIESGKIKADTPGGIFYQMVGYDKKGLVPSGLVNNEPEVIEAISPGDDGRYLSKEGKSNGSISRVDTDTFNEILTAVKAISSKTGSYIKQGKVDVNPVQSGSDSPCIYCDYTDVCGHKEEAYKPKKYKKSEIEEFRDELRRVSSNGI